MKYKILLLLAYFVSLGGSAQKYKVTETGIKIFMQSVNEEIMFYSSGIARIIKLPKDSTLHKESLSVVMQPQKIPIAVTKSSNTVSLKTDILNVSVDLNTGKISFFNKIGEGLFAEKDYGVQFAPVLDAEKNSFIVRQIFMPGNKDECIYGLGQQQNGRLNQRGQRFLLQNENMKICIPFFQSIRGYGVFWDNYAPVTFNDNLQETSFESLGDCVDYYFLYGGNADGVVSQMRKLTGQAPLFPLWVYGYLQSRERYKNQCEIVSVVEKYRQLQVPLDGIIQDWQYWGKDSNWNAMSFDTTTYPDPQKMVRQIHALNAHLMIVAWPGFGPQTPQYKEFFKKKMLIDFDTWPPNSGAKPYDVYNPLARDIYWNYLNKGVFSFDTDAWWLDSSEPDHINVNDEDFYKPTYFGTFRSVKNAFPLMHIKGVYEHQRATTLQKRVSILTRSAFAGQQRYAANSWSGDIVSSWQTLQKQIPAALNFSLTGIPYWNADIGGFFLWNYNGNKALQNNAYKELYVRWIQFATFTPMMRSHGTDAPREIYQFGNRGEKFFDAIEKYIQLRYAFLPYLYSTAWDVTNNAGSFMRPLFADYISDKNVNEINNEFLLGKSVLVIPVVEPLYVSSQDGKGIEDYSKTKTTKVYLPAGTSWIDFWTNEYIPGGISIDRPAPIDIIPLYIKAGAILPLGPKVQFASEKSWESIEIKIYEGANGKFTLYEDENDNYNYEQGEYSLIDFLWDEHQKILTIDNRKGSFKGMIKKRVFKLHFIKPDGKNHTKIVSYKGARVDVRMK
jgi:alpha-D-xyloside xylohydrolase